MKAYKLLPSSKTDGFQCHNHNRCDYFCSAIGIDYFPMVFRYKIVVNDVFRWLSIIGPAMRLYRCIHTWYLSPASPAVLVEKKFVMWRKFSKWQIVMWRSFSTWEHRKSSPHDKCGAKCVIRRNLSCFHMKDFSTWAFFSISLSQLTLFCFEICFVAFYADFSRNLLCCDLRASVWRKKAKYQVWLFHCSNAQIFQYSYVPISQCSNMKMFQCPNVRIIKC